MAKKPTWNRQTFLKHLAIKAYLSDNNLYYAQLLTLAQFQLITNISLAQLKTIKWLQKAKFTDLNYQLTEKELQELCLEFDFDFTNVKTIDPYAIAQNYEQLNHTHKWIERAPIITVMGHVDHGKTTLLDTLRRSNLVRKEVGKITQKMAAYQINWKNSPLTFIDTPGHKLFSLMRARGSQITDLVILVVAANEGVKPQTIEALQHAQTSQVPIIVFINKIDLPNSQVETIKTTLTKHNLTPIEWGGKTLYLEGSAIKLTTLKPLLNAILTTSQALKLRYCQTCLGKAVVLEAKQSRSGPLNQIICQSGSFHLQQHLVVSNPFHYGKLRIINQENQAIKTLFAGQTAGLIGIPSLLKTSSIIYAFNNKAIIDEVATSIANLNANQPINVRKSINHANLWNLSGDVTNLPTNFIIKVDTKGTEAVLQAQINHFNTTNSNLKIISLATGPFTTTDFHFAVASRANVILFNLPSSSQLQQDLKNHHLELKSFNLLHELLEFCETFGQKSELKNNLVKLGEAKIIRIFRHSKLGIIVGCMITSGEIKLIKSSTFHLYRNQSLITETLQIKSMQQERDQIKAAKVNQEIGIIFKKPVEFELNDRLIQWEIKKI